ncbi:MAG: ABC transporter ATP-binding protein [Dehalococcoidia bacterium]|nr:ABC transporter ATP-binding protein [Dehalococcoidia bacterium]
MPSIKIKNVSKYVCRKVNLEILDGELLVLLGPNGAGKSTLLNVIAGLIEYEGSVLFDGEQVDELSPRKRKIGYLFQNLNLFPHMDVASNIAYSLKVQKRPQSALEARVNELLQMMKIKHLSSRYPGQLSGGEKQRVALARALAMAPQVLLLDEPLSSLDMQASKYLRMELRQLQKKLGITTIYVTHDLKEAGEMADRIAVIESGRMEQVARPGEVFFSPVSKKVSDFIGAPNILDCTYCHGLGRGVVEVTCGGLPIIVPDDGNEVKKIALLPRDIYVSESKPPGPEVNRFKGIITGIDAADDMVRLKVKAGENRLIVEMPHHIYRDMDLVVGKEVFLILKLRSIKVYRNEEQV